MSGSIARGALVTLAALALIGSSASAQAPTGARWAAWLGCWQATQPGGDYGAAQFAPPTVCITPTADAQVVKVSTVVDSKVVQEDVIDASGTERAINTTGCSGTQRASWSADQRRIYLKAQTNCEGTRTATSAILSMTPQGEWIDVRNVTAGEGSSVRVAKYRDMGVTSKIPSEIASALSARSVASQGARIAAGAPIGAAAVQEALAASDSLVTAAWLLERGQRFSLSAKELVSLADAGVPGSVTDAMIAVSHPTTFNLARADDSADDRDGRRRHTIFMDPYSSRWGYSPYGYGYGYGSGYGYGYGYGNPYGGYYGGGYYGGAPIIVVSPGEAAARGQVVKGRGYQQGAGSTNNSGRSANTSDRSSTSSSPSTSNTSTNTNTSTQSQPASTEQRTAKPRP